MAMAMAMARWRFGLWRRCPRRVMVGLGAGLAAATAGAAGFTTMPHPFQLTTLGLAASLSAGLAAQSCTPEVVKKSTCRWYLPKEQ